MLLKTKGREMDSVSEDASLGQNTDASDTIDLHLHIWVTVRVTEVGQVRPPRCIFSVSFDNHGVLIKSVSQSESSF